MPLKTGVLALILLAVVVAVLTAPARLLGFVLPGDQIVLSGFTGTLWRGTASRCLLAVPGGFLQLGSVDWKLRPLSLLLFAPRLQLASQWGQQRLSGDLVLHGAQDITLRDADAQFSASLVKQFAPLELDGDISAQITDLQVQSGLVTAGEGRLVWQRASWASPQGLLPLGTYAVDFSQQPNAPLVGEILTLAGPITAQGRARLSGRNYSLAIEVGSEQQPMPASLQRALSLLARPVGDGYQLALEGEL
ncbi:MAG: type II secretion system protein N [Halieaceae bacterium]